MHHGTSQPSTASRWLASSSRYLSGAGCSPRRAVYDAKPQRLMGCLYTHMGLPALFPEPFVHSKIALHGALQCEVRRGALAQTPARLPQPHHMEANRAWASDACDSSWQFAIAKPSVHQLLCREGRPRVLPRHGAEGHREGVTVGHLQKGLYILHPQTNGMVP